METALRARLLGNTTAQTRVDWGLRPQGKSLPAIRLTVVSSPRDYTMEGPQATQQYRVQADCYGATYGAAKELGDAVTAILEPSAGDFLASFVIGQRDVPELTDTGPVHCRTVDYLVTHISA
jgi:hypothetical protein